MPIIRPKDVVEATNRVYPIGLDGTGIIPLSEQNLADVASIVNLAGQIHRELLPKREGAKTFATCMGVIKIAIRNERSRSEKAGHTGFGFALQAMPEFEGRNPLAVLRDVLSHCSNFTPKEIRRKLLELIADFDSAGITPFPDTRAIGPLNLTLVEIRRQMENCEHESSITLKRSSSGYSASLTAAGRMTLEEPDSAAIDSGPGTVFISCGQFTASEIALGQALARLVNELTPNTGYFAQN
jgi:hypothetical protein